MTVKEQYMQIALHEAYKGIRKKHGGPFGSILVKDGKIVGRGHNRVLVKKDPTCHGEIEAIRNACKNLGTHDLSGCELYTTAEPCPMCLGAILWANIAQVYYGCGRLDTETIGFRDNKFYDFLKGDAGSIRMEECGRKECLELFEEYSKDEERQSY